VNVLKFHAILHNHPAGGEAARHSSVVDFARRRDGAFASTAAWLSWSDAGWFRRSDRQPAFILYVQTFGDATNGH
jgi:hypothetical protein